MNETKTPIHADIIAAYTNHFKDANDSLAPCPKCGGFCRSGTVCYESRISELETSHDQWKAVAERLAEWLTDIKNMPEYDQDDVHRLRHKATIALTEFNQLKSK